MTEDRHERAPGDRPSREIRIGSIRVSRLHDRPICGGSSHGHVVLGCKHDAALARRRIPRARCPRHAQMGIHLVFFLHITTGPESTNNVLALAFGVLIVFVVVAGTCGSWPI
jgi:Heme/copper-type cytochrome/quinol oxidase, subunit 4